MSESGENVPDLVQINSDGSTVVGEDPPKVPYADQVEIIKNALDKGGWTVVKYDEDPGHRRHIIEIEKTGEKISAILYVLSPFNYSPPRKDGSEKRVQLGTPTGSDKAQRDHDFGLPPNGNPKCALLAIYRRDDLVLFGAWVAKNFVDHGKNRNAWMNSRLLAAAARTGFARELNRTGGLLCAFTPDMLPAYLRDMALIHGHTTESDAEDVEAGENDAEAINVPVNPVDKELPRNRIFFGAPGTGKSYNLNVDLEKNFPSEFLMERTTFYPDTTSGIFIGAYRPTPIYRNIEGEFVGADRTSPAPNQEPMIDYSCEPGPFLRLLGRALSNPEHNFCLVIEEINRANASAVFAEAFQLLDRDDEGNGRYTVTLAPEARTYLASLGHSSPVRIPSNMYIWATMNSADQGVLPLDSAFKRRWTMEYVGLNDGEEAVRDWEIKLPFLINPIKWNKFRRVVNSHLEQQGVAEDRLLGPFFMTPRELTRKGDFESKILQYLRDDVLRHAPSKLFSGSPSIGGLMAAYRAGENIFVPEIKFDEN